MEKGKKKRILIIDDEPAMVQCLEDWLKSKGYETISCKHPIPETFDFLNEKYDLIVTDHQMPNITGDVIIHQALLSKANRHTPIILLSGYISPTLRQEFSKNPQIQWVDKPFDLDVLVLLIQKTLGVS